MDLKEKIKALKTDISEMVTAANRLYDELEGKGDNATADERAKLNNVIDAGKVKRDELHRLEELQSLDDATKTANQPLASSDTRATESVTWGATVTASDEFRSANQRNAKSMEPVRVRGGVKALYAGTTATGGALIQRERIAGIVDLAPQRGLEILDLIQTQETAVDAIEYVVITSRTNNAAVVPEYASGNFGLKPESTMAFDVKTAAVKTIASWVAASRQILMDAPRLESQVNGELTYMIRRVLEDQVIAGDGTGSNFLGMLNTSGIQLRQMHATTPVGRNQTTGDSRMTTLRRAITDITLAFYEASGILMNPIDLESIEITEYNANRYSVAFDPVTRRVWRVPVVETTAIAANTALIGNFQLAATLWDRMQVDIRVGEPNDYFLRNAVAILAELRAAFAVTRPQALEKVTMI